MSSCRGYGRAQNTSGPGTVEGAGIRADVTADQESVAPGRTGTSPYHHHRRPENAVLDPGPRIRGAELGT